MGASGSSEDAAVESGESGFTLEGLVEQTNRILREATEIIGACIQEQISDLRNFEARAMAQVETAFVTIQEKLEDISAQSNAARACVEKRTGDLSGIRTTMRNNLLDCYNKHNKALEKLKTERAAIYNQASQFKIDAQRIIESCMASADRIDCLKTAIAELANRGRALVGKFNGVVRAEAEARLKFTRLMVECDKKAIQDAQKQANKVIEDIKRCCKAVEDKK